MFKGCGRPTLSTESERPEVLIWLLHNKTVEFTAIRWMDGCHLGQLEKRLMQRLGGDFTEASKRLYRGYEHQWQLVRMAVHLYQYQKQHAPSDQLLGNWAGGCSSTLVLLSGFAQTTGWRLSEQNVGLGSLLVWASGALLMFSWSMFSHISPAHSLKEDSPDTDS